MIKSPKNRDTINNLKTPLITKSPKNDSATLPKRDLTTLLKSNLTTLPPIKKPLSQVTSKQTEQKKTYNKQTQRFKSQKKILPHQPENKNNQVSFSDSQTENAEVKPTNTNTNIISILKNESAYTKNQKTTNDSSLNYKSLTNHEMATLDHTSYSSIRSLTSHSSTRSLTSHSSTPPPKNTTTTNASLNLKGNDNLKNFHI